MSNPIFDFINVIWTYRKGEETINALYNGGLSLDSYAEMLYNKRIAFDEGMFELLNNIETLKDLPFNYLRLVEQFRGYDNFDFSKQVVEGTKEYWEIEYHKVRYRELSNAVKNMDGIIRSKGLVFSDNIRDKDPSKRDRLGYHFYYRGLYTDEQIELIYHHLLGKYLHPETLFEDFVYYMTGRGKDIPINGLIWLKDSDELAYFIDTFCSCNRKWMLGQNIFDRKRLASAYCQSKKENPFKKLQIEVNEMQKYNKR